MSARRPDRFRRSAAARFREDSGQVIALAVVSFTALLGIAGLVIDVGAWYHQQRVEQATADAAALAGAQDLPDNPDAAVQLAVKYASANGGGLSASDVAISSDRAPNDTITVNLNQPADAYFTRLFGVHTVAIHVDAAARSDGVSSAQWVAPIAVSSQHPMLQCSPPPCTGATQINLLDLHQPGGSSAAGTFGLLDLRLGGDGSAGQTTVAAWLENGYDQSMPLGTYDGVPSTMFNGSAFLQALRDRVGTEVLFPVYRPPIVLGGSNAQYDIVGWVGFQITSYSASGNSGTIFGSFTRYIARGLQAQNPTDQPDFGVRSVQLVK
jgi:Flp pilus assembly protein TadG